MRRITRLTRGSAEAGIELFLAKPVDPRALLAAVEQAHSRRASPLGSVYEPAPTPSIQDGYLDHGVLEEMARLSNDPSFMQNLARQFSRDAQELVDAIAIALVEKDYARSRELAHARKGSSMMAGAVRLRDSAARAEKIMDRHVGGEADDAIGNLRETLKAM